MNKKGKTDRKMVLILVAIAVVIVLYLLLGTDLFAVRNGAADISKGEEGTGLYLKLYDKDGNVIDVPDWFKVSTIAKVGPFTIVRHPPAPSCTTRTQCSGYATNPNIICWNDKCVLGNVASMDLGVSVENPSTSEIAFTNVAPFAASPAEFWTKLDKTAHVKLSPGDPVKSWSTTSPMSLSTWEGAQQVFSVTVAGTNEYTGTTFSTSDSITLAFDADPTGAFTVSVVSPI